LIQPPDVPPSAAAPTEPIQPTPSLPESVLNTELGAPATAEAAADRNQDTNDQGGGKVKAAAVVAGAAALANKVRQEAPKKIRQLREKRAAGRCVIVTEADGHYLAVGPYKDEDAARQALFKVGGTAHVAELLSTTAFFDPQSPD
jgi:hypothetical protein